MINFKKHILGLLLIFITIATGIGQDLGEQFDQLLNEQFPSEGPGATALVAKQGEIIYHKAFGQANLELEVNMRPEMIFEIGSITKQFTAVSILMLMEQGKLSLKDNITKFIEDYPTQGHYISIHHLLTHTSGIKSYTSLPSMNELGRNDYQPEEFIETFKNEEMDFAPGEQFRYNNSAYFILGHIIEKVSGMTYKEFVEANIFSELGMSDSYYGSMKEIIPNRASGYQMDEAWVNAEYLSLTIPYSAGSLMSTVKDLFKWNRAIRNNTLLKKESIDLAFTNYTLNDGEKTNYGYGWFLSGIGGSPTIEHGGGIYGYLTNSIYLPDEDVFVAVFSNCDCNPPQMVSTRMAALAIDKAFHDEKDIISLNVPDLEKWVGVYEFEDGSTRYISLEGDELFSQRSGSYKMRIFPVSKTQFIYENSLSLISFDEEKEGVVANFEDRAFKAKGNRTSTELPVKEEIKVEEDILQRYSGKYELMPGFEIDISVENGKLMAQATGQPKFQIFPESETIYFYKIVDAKIEFIKNETGDFDSFILYQGGQEIKGLKK